MVDPMHRTLLLRVRRRRAQPWMGTIVDIALSGYPEQCDAAFRHAFEQVSMIHRLMSFHDCASDVGRINDAVPGQALTVDPHTAYVLRMALAIGDAAQGAFDCTAASVLVRRGLLPGRDCIEYTHGTGESFSPSLCVDQTRVTKSRPCLIDLGGIAKGYAVDLAIAAIAQEGIKEVVVNAGGDLAQRGSHPCTVRIRHPQWPGRVAASVSIHNCALASSSNCGWGLAGSNSVSSMVRPSDATLLAAGGGASVTAPTCIVADAMTKVVLAAGNPVHRVLELYQARTLFHREPAICLS